MIWKIIFMLLLVSAVVLTLSYTAPSAAVKSPITAQISFRKYL